jgi:hypothetical protein
VRAPILVAVGGVDREDIVFGGPDQRAVHLDQAGLEAGELLGVVSAQYLQPAGIPDVDLTELRVTFGSERLVVAGPIPGGRLRL